MSFDKDPIMTIINKNLSYKDRKEVISIMTESTSSKEKIYTNIGNYFLGRVASLNPMKLLKKYADSKGDITKLEGYEITVGCVKALESDVKVSRDAKIIEEALLNIKNRKKSFTVGFKSDSAISKLIYAAAAKACVASTSLLINQTDIGGGYKGSNNFDHNRPVSIYGLELFNKYCKDGSVDRILRDDLNRKIAKEDFLPFDLVAALGSAFIVGIRSMVYWVYYTRIDLADYLEQQAAYLELNKTALQNRKDIPEAKKKEIIAKQTEWQKRLLDLADKIQIDDIKAARKAKEQAEKDSKEMKKDDVTNGGSNTDTSTPDFF